MVRNGVFIYIAYIYSCSVFTINVWAVAEMIYITIMCPLVLFARFPLRKPDRFPIRRSFLQTKAEAANTGLIVIGANKGWKQKVNLGNRTNQNFVAIPYKTLIDMIRYKAALKGIEVKVVEEGYTSGTSYLDGEFPEAASYDRKRRIKRGLFKSNSGTCINADVNAAYQMMKLAGVCNLQIKAGEKVTRIKAA